MIELTKDEGKSLADFIEIYFIGIIHDDPDVDNLEWVCDICSAYRKLKEGGEEE